MPSVNSTDSGLGNYYHKTLKDLQEEVEFEAKRNRELREQQTEALDKNYKQALLRKDKEAEDTLESYREDSNQNLGREKEKYRSALDEFKRSPNPAFNPKDRAELTQSYNKTITDLDEQNRTEATRNRQAQENQLDRLESSFKNDLNKKDRETTETIKNLMDSTQEAVSRERQQSQSEIERIKNSTYNAKGQVPGSISPELYKKQVQEMMDASQIRHENDLMTVSQLEKNAQNNSIEQTRKNDSRIQTLTESQSDQIEKLDEKLKTLTNFTQEASKHESDVIRNLTLDNEKKTRSERERIENSFNAVTDKLAQNNQDKDRYYQRRSVDQAQEKNAYFTDLINKQNQDNFQTTKRLQDQFKTELSQLELSKKNDTERANDTLANLLERANEDRRQSLEQQAESSADTLNRTRKDAQEQVSTLEKTLQKQRTSIDANNISPAAEVQVRNAVIKDYEKKLNSEVERNKLNTDHIQKKYIDQYQKVLEEQNDKETLTNQRNASDRAFEESRYLDSIQDTNYRVDNQIREQRTSHDREDEALIRQFSNLLEHQKRDYEHILENSRADSETRLASFRQESELNSKTAYRAFNTRQNEIIRDYEKKLADQKSESESKLEDLKAQTQNDVRDAERRTKQEIESLIKNNEQKTAQLESQSKERERAITQYYQDELERTKRSYELISKKKS